MFECGTNISLLSKMQYCYLSIIVAGGIRAISKLPFSLFYGKALTPLTKEPLRNFPQTLSVSMTDIYSGMRKVTSRWTCGLSWTHYELDMDQDWIYYLAPL